MPPGYLGFLAILLNLIPKGRVMIGRVVLERQTKEGVKKNGLEQRNNKLKYTDVLFASSGIVEVGL